MRERQILAAVTLTAERLLAAPAWTAAMGEVLAVLGEAADVSRVVVFEKAEADAGDIHITQTFEWAGHGLALRVADPSITRFPLFAAGFGRWASILGAGEVVSGNVRTFPPAEQHQLLEAHGIQSIVVVPIHVQGHWWGFIAFDDCTRERTWLPEETRALHAAANLVGTAIRRNQVEASLRRLAAAVDQVTEAILITDTSGRIVFANPAFERSTGYSLQDVAGHTTGFLASDRHAPDFFRHIWQTIAAGNPWAGQMTSRRKDGSLLEEAVTIAPVRDESGTIVHYVAVKRDVSREAALESQIRQLQKIEAIGQLAGGIAHDFNNVLTAILGYTDMLLDSSELDSDTRTCLDEIAKAGHRAAGLTRQLLTFSRQQVVQPIVFDLDTTLANLHKMLQRLIGEHIELTIASGREPCLIDADPGQIEQIIVNLAVNARDAMPHGGRIEIALGRVGVESAPEGWAEVSAGEHVRLVFRDNGHGMSDEVKARLFEPFFTTKAVGKGTGLGLSTVFGIVKQARGFIEVESAPECGTTFRIYLPCALAAPETLNPAGSAPPRGAETILLVEDDGTVRLLTSSILRRLGYTVIEAENGEAAALLAEGVTGRIDLLLTDMIMPGASGADVAQSLGSPHPESRVLFMSGYTDGEISHQGVLDAGATFLQKPFTTDSLARAVRAALAQPAPHA